MSVPKIVLDPGHGGDSSRGGDPGAVANGLKEKDVVLDLAQRVARELDKYKCEVKLTRNTDVFIPIGTRSKIANRWGAEVFVSIHINSGGGIGYESFISRVAGARSIRLQNLIHPLSAKFFSKDRGKKRAMFSVLWRTRCASVLVENGFIDSVYDANKLKTASVKDGIAKSIATGIVKYFDLQKKVQPKKELSELDKAIAWVKKNKIVNDTANRPATLQDLIIVAYRLYRLLKK